LLLLGLAICTAATMAGVTTKATYTIAIRKSIMNRALLRKMEQVRCRKNRRKGLKEEMKLSAAMRNHPRKNAMATCDS
jgi:hypothetical protein